MTEYESMTLCPDTNAGIEALHEAIQDGWEVFCQWQESGLNYQWINHIAMRRPAKADD